MSIQWSFETGQCTTTSTHIVIDQCTMLGQNGIADPYENDLVLNIHMHFGWNTPDLGENRRGPPFSWSTVLAKRRHETS